MTSIPSRIASHRQSGLSYAFIIEGESKGEKPVGATPAPQQADDRSSHHQLFARRGRANFIESNLNNMSNTREAKYTAALEFGELQVKALTEQHPDYFPIYTTGGKWHHGGELWTDWTGGFLAG